MADRAYAMEKWWTTYTSQTNERQLNTLSANPWASFSTSRKTGKSTTTPTSPLSPRRVVTPLDVYRPPTFGTDPPSTRKNPTFVQAP